MTYEYISTALMQFPIQIPRYIEKIRRVTMIRIPIIILCTFLYLTESLKASPCDSNSVVEDLQDEYYTIANTDVDEFQSSDGRDAATVVDKKGDTKVVFSIFLYREKIRRYTITKTINNLLDSGTITEFDWFNEEHVTQIGQPDWDLLFCLAYSDNIVLTSYLYNYFFTEGLEDRITIALVLTKDMNGLIRTYDQIQENYKQAFKKGRNDQKSPYKNLLRVWNKDNREQLDKDDPTPDIVQQNAETLKKNQDKDGFHELRDQLELITIKKSIKFARAVILAFEKLNDGKTLEDILNESANNGKLDKNLAYAYSSLALYIKNKHAYIAKLLAECSDGSDAWAAWMMCIAVVHPQEWPKIDEEFKKKNNGVSLSTFILQKLSQNKIVAEAMAVAVDSTFKPTTFKEIPIDNSPGPSPPPSPPPTPDSADS